jgi:protein-S-isoprenylcysteine O-methyltransferase Ste14
MTSFQHSPSDAGERDAPGVITLPPLIYLVALAVGFGLEALLPSASLPRALAWPVGGILLVAGVALMVSFLAAFHLAQTPVDVRQATTAIVTTGPYRLTRNPAYVAMTLIYAAIAVITSTLWAFAPLVAALILVDRGVIAREERYLERKFGEEYLRYKAGTRRWL